MERSKPHFAILSSPGLGHLTPVIVLGKRLITHHNARVTVLAVTTSTSPAESNLLQISTATSLTSGELLDFLPVSISGDLVDPNAKIVTQLCVMMREAVPSIRDAIALMKLRPDVFIVDLFGHDCLSIADEFGIPKYVYVPCTAWFTALTVYCHVLDGEIDGQYVDQTEYLKIPGCKSLKPENVVDPMLDRNDQQYHEYVRMGVHYTRSSDGILMNTWEDIETTSIKALRLDEKLRSVLKVPVYPIGPLTRTVEQPEGSKSELLQWLDKQPDKSVIYVSFGSGGTLSIEQLTELAWGLELSQQRFVWVIRPPSTRRSDGTFFTSGSESSSSDGISNYLPEGFLNRTQNLGIVIPYWTTQVEILRHSSVGGFLTHCGWNSTLESITAGVPMIAWPLYAEQRVNATIITEDLSVAIRPTELPTKKMVERDEVEKMVRCLMQSKEGKAMRKKIEEVKKTAEKSLSKDGSSHNSMLELLKNCGMDALCSA